MGRRRYIWGVIVGDWTHFGEWWSAESLRALLGRVMCGVGGGGGYGTFGGVDDSRSCCSMLMAIVFRFSSEDSLWEIRSRSLVRRCRRLVGSSSESICVISVSRSMRSSESDLRLVELVVEVEGDVLV